MGEKYLAGDGVPKNRDEGLKWCKKAANAGYVGAKVYLGLEYNYGGLIRQDYSKAAEYFRMAAKQHNASAQRYLGIAYFYGKGVQQNGRAAIRWFLKSAAQHDSIAQMYLGFIAYTGSEDSLPDMVTAYVWFWMANYYGNPDGLTAIYDLAKSMDQTQINDAEKLIEKSLKGEIAISDRQTSHIPD